MDERTILSGGCDTWMTLSLILVMNGMRTMILASVLPSGDLGSECERGPKVAIKFAISCEEDQTDDGLTVDVPMATVRGPEKNGQLHQKSSNMGGTNKVLHEAGMLVSETRATLYNKISEETVKREEDVPAVLEDLKEHVEDALKMTEEGRHECRLPKVVTNLR